MVAAAQARALDCAVAAGEVTTDIDPRAAAESKGASWCAQQADALVAVVKSYLGGGHGDEGGATADHYQVVVHADAKAVTGGGGCSDLPIDTVKRFLRDCRPVHVAEDENGNPLDVGRKQRTVSTARRRALCAAGVGDADASRDGFCPTTVQREERAEVRETAPVYRLRRSASG